MAFKVKDIAENTAEDFIDDGVSNLVYAMGNCMFGDSSSNKKCEGVVKDAFEEALEGAGQTLKYSIMSAAIYRTTTYILPKIILGSTAIYTYIKSARVINTVKKSVNNTFGKVPLFGGFVTSFVNTTTSLAVGSQDERLAMAQMANKNVDSMTTALSKEREIATMQVSAQKKQVMDTLGLNHGAKGLRDNKKIAAYHLKMKMGTWTTSTADKKLFYDVVPKEYIQSTFIYNSSFVEELNKYTEYAKTTEDKIINNATVLLKTLASKGVM